MQNPVRRVIVATAALLALSTLLAACTGSNAPSKTVTVTKTVTPQKPKSVVVHLHPAVGKLLGVVRHGISAETNPVDGGLTYTCAKGLETIKTDVATQSLNFNGTNITVANDLQNLEPKSKTPSYFETEETLSFSGNLTLFLPKLVSLIVLPDDGSDIPTASDEQVVNLQGYVPKNSVGIHLDVEDFHLAEMIDSVNLCIKP